MPAHLPVTTRRTAISGALLGLVAVAGCDVDDLRPPDTGGSPGPTGTGSPSPATPGQDARPDQALVDSAVALVLPALTLVTTTRRAHPRLRKPLASLRRTHAAHARALDGLDDDVAGPGVEVGASLGDALAEVRTAEESLQRRLAAIAVRADSGALARLLASMSASVAQHLAVLPSSPGGLP